MTKIKMTNDGLLIIDKPKGWTSHDVVKKVKRLLGARKVGHTGTLDPDATGVLVLCLNRATRWARQICNMSKSYQAVIYLGCSTDTGDATGQVLERAVVPPLSKAAIEAVLNRFRGVIWQQVPRFSSVKVQGRRLYQWARQNKDLPRPVRQVAIDRICLEVWSSPLIRIHVDCSRGTYIRSLAEDIGRALQVPAHLHALRRLCVGPYDIGAAVTMAELETEIDSGLFFASGRLLTRLDQAYQNGSLYKENLL